MVNYKLSIKIRATDGLMLNGEYKFTVGTIICVRKGKTCILRLYMIIDEQAKTSMRSEAYFGGVHA